MSGLALSLLGPLSITVDERPLVGIRVRPAVALCIYLACQPERHRREHLMGLFWPDWSPTSAQQNLRQNLYTLRQALPEVAARDGRGSVPLVLADRETLQLNPDAAVDRDVDRFTTLLYENTPEARAAAVSLYRGDFLADFYLPDGAPFEEWAAALRADLRRQMLEALDRLAAHALDHGAADKAAAYARRQLELDNLRESAYRQLMLALAARGHRAEALVQYELCSRLLRAELHIDPSVETRLLAERVAAEEINRFSDDSVTEYGSIVVNTAPGHNLPLQLNSFIGRQSQLTDLINLLTNSSARLITITGPGGIGKTRLALEAARRCATSYSHGVIFIPLESAKTSDDMVERMMAGLGLHGTTSIPPHEAVLNLLHNKNLLLVLDTLEHLLPDINLISLIREEAPHVKILATSRSALKLSGEHIYAVPPMTNSGPATDQTVLVQSDAVTLFEARAREVQPDFAVSASNAADVVEICRLLGRLPLALEMAAAHTRTLSLRQLRQQLSFGDELLAGGPRDAPARHRSIRDTLSWSYDLLAPDQRALFRGFGIFPEGCTLASAIAIAPEPIRKRGDFIHTLSGLIDQSMIQTQTVNGRRIYRLHEISLLYARELLVVHGEFHQTMSKLLDYILGLVAQLDQHFRDPSRNDWLAMFEPEANHVWRLLEWGLSTNDASIVTRCLALTGLMLHYWNIRGQQNLARQWTEQALQRGRELDLDKSSLGPAWITSASMALIHADIQNGLEHAESALYVARESGDQPLEIRALHLMGLCAFARAELELAEEIWTEALPLAEYLGDPGLLATVIDDLGNLASRRGDYEQAIVFHLREQEISLEAADLYSEFYAVINLGEVSMLMERPTDAALYYGRALKICRELNDSRGLAQTMITQAALLIQLHRSMEALGLLHEVIVLAWDIQNLDIVLRGLEMLVHSEVLDLNLDTRARFAGALSHLSERYSSASLPTEKEALVALKERLSREMDPSVFALEWRIGRSYNWEQAVELAHELIETGKTSASK